MKRRIISALCMVPLIIFVYFRGIPLLCLTFLLSGFALYEFYNGFGNIKIYPPMTLGFISHLCLYIVIVWGEFIRGNDMKVYAHCLCLWVFCTVTAGMLYGLFEDNKLLDGCIMSLGCLYISFCFVHIPLITRIDYYDRLVWLVFISALGSDIFAYFSGILLGKHKLCPDISPNKTVEGCIGGIIGSAILCGIFGIMAYPQLVVHCIVIGVFGAAFSQCGDLIASMFKRKMEIKDYSNLIPGHGGILDRFDSVLITAPFVYYYILVIIRP